MERVKKKISGCQGLGGWGEMNRWNTEDFYGCENTVYDSTVMDI